MARDIVIKLFGMGAVDQGKTLGVQFKLEQLLSFLMLMKNGKFDSQALEQYQDLYNYPYSAAILESANNLINEGKFSEAVEQEKRLLDTHLKIFRTNLVIKYIEMDMWEAVPKFMLREETLTAAITTLCSYGKFVEAHKIFAPWEQTTIQIHEALRDEKFDEVMDLANYARDDCKLSISIRLMEKGQVEKAYQVACGINELKMKNEALKFINHHLEG